MSTEAKESRRRPFDILRRSHKQLEITGYHAGQIQIDKPVMINVGATVVGDIFAPQVRVAGQLLGSVVSRRTDVTATGEIWGDLHTTSLHIEPGARIRGWVSELEESGYLSLQKMANLPQAPIIPNESDLPTDLPQDSPLRRDKIQLTAMNQLRTELTVARAAQAEIEYRFEQRLDALAGDALARASLLEVALAEAQAELVDLKGEARRARAELETVTVSSLDQASELEMAQQELEEQRRIQVERNFEMDQIQAAKNAVDSQLRETCKDVDRLKERTKNLEAALQSSLQHGAGQDDALLHWQELAESTDQAYQLLRQQLKAEEARMKESERQLGELKKAYQDVEQKWQTSQEQLQIRQAEIEGLQRQLQQMTSDQVRSEQPGVLLATETALVEAHSEIARLRQAQIEQAEESTWQNARQQTALMELRRVQTRVQQHEELVGQLQSKVDQQAQFIQNLKRVTRKHVRGLEAEIERLQQQQAEGTS